MPRAPGRSHHERAEAARPPLRVFFGTQGNKMLQEVYTDRLGTWADWADLSDRAQGGEAA